MLAGERWGAERRGEEKLREGKHHYILLIYAYEAAKFILKLMGDQGDKRDSRDRNEEGIKWTETERERGRYRERKTERERGRGREREWERDRER